MRYLPARRSPGRRGGIAGDCMKCYWHLAGKLLHRFDAHWASAVQNAVAMRRQLPLESHLSLAQSATCVGIAQAAHF